MAESWDGNLNSEELFRRFGDQIGSILDLSPKWYYYYGFWAVFDCLR